MYNLSRDLELIQEIEQQLREIDLKTARLIEDKRQRYSTSDLCTCYQHGLLSPNEVQDIKKESHS